MHLVRYKQRHENQYYTSAVLVLVLVVGIVGADIRLIHSIALDPWLLLAPALFLCLTTAIKRASFGLTLPPSACVTVFSITVPLAQPLEFAFFGYSSLLIAQLTFLHFPKWKYTRIQYATCNKVGQTTITDRPS